MLYPHTYFQSYLLRTNKIGNNVIGYRPSRLSEYYVQSNVLLYFLTEKKLL